MDDKPDSEIAELMANAAVLEVPPDSGIPTEYEFEIYRLRRRVAELEDIVRDKNERNLRAIQMLEDELQMWRTFMHQNIAEKYGEIRRRMARLESTLTGMKEPRTRSYQPLEVSKSWQKAKTGRQK